MYKAMLQHVIVVGIDLPETRVLCFLFISIWSQHDKKIKDEADHTKYEKEYSLICFCGVHLLSYGLYHIYNMIDYDDYMIDD